MKEEDLKRYQQRLLSARDRLGNEINRIVDSVFSTEQPVGEHDRAVSEAVDKEIILERAEEGLRDAVAAALRRIEDGTYGRCEDCGAAIAKARLDAVPHTPFCIRCERKHES